MSVLAVILAAGSGQRFGGDKTTFRLRGKPIWQYSYETFRDHPGVNAVGLVGSQDNLDAFNGAAAEFAIVGGGTRTESAGRALERASDFEFILIHDAARPFVDRETIDRVLEATRRIGAAAPAVPVVDTLRHREAHSVVDRAVLGAMQTPQGARVDWLRQAYAEVDRHGATDEMELLNRAGYPFELVSGSASNFKITAPSDVRRVSEVLGPPETRTGLGYDIHAFSTDPERPLMLGGVRFEGHPALEGHSDADVILHAVTDALLGALALGDIGQHFPPSDPQWRNADSIQFVTFAGSLLRERGWRILNLDVSVLAETPKIMPRAHEIRKTISDALQTDSTRISVKATTNERLGAIGRREGIAAFATATLTQTDEA